MQLIIKYISIRAIHSSILLNIGIWIALLFLFEINYLKAQSLPNYTIDELTVDVPLSEIEITDKKVEIVKGGKSLGGMVDVKGESRLMGPPVSSTFFKGQIIVSDPANNMLIAAEEDGLSKWLTGRTGSGPGEFLEISQLSSNQNLLIAKDRGNSAIHFFDINLIPAGSVPLTRFGDVTVTDQYIFVPASSRDDNLLAIYNAQEPYSRVGSFFSSIIQRGYQPQGYNYLKLASNSSGEIVITSPALPYLFIFDNELTHLHTVKLYGNIVSDIIDENPPADAIRTTDNPMIRNLIGAVELTDNGSILMGIGRTLYVLNKENDGYVLHKAVQYYPGGSHDIGENPLGLFDINEISETNQICLSSIYYKYLYCFDKD